MAETPREPDRFDAKAREILVAAGVRDAQLAPPSSFWAGVAKYLAAALRAELAIMRGQDPIRTTPRAGEGCVCVYCARGEP